MCTCTPFMHVHVDAYKLYVCYIAASLLGTYKWHSSGVVSRATDTSWVDSNHTPDIQVTLSISLNIWSGESDAGVGGGVVPHHTGVGVGHSDCVAQLYPIRSPWWRPAEHQYTIWYWLWWQITWLWGGTCMYEDVLIKMHFLLRIKCVLLSYCEPI